MRQYRRKGEEGKKRALFENEDRMKICLEASSIDSSTETSGSKGGAHQPRDYAHQKVRVMVRERERGSM